MPEPVFFVVEKRNGGEGPAIYHDVFRPSRSTVYALRLDKLPDCEKWLACPLDKLYRTYCALRDANRLPPSNLAEPARRSAEPAKRLVGEWWEPPPRPWLDTPPEPYPEPGTLKAKPEAPAYIRPAEPPVVVESAPPAPTDGREIFLTIGSGRST